MTEVYVTADVHPEGWPHRRCIVCNGPLFRRYYPNSRRYEELRRYKVRRTCGELCRKQDRSDLKKNAPSFVIPERPPFPCPICGCMATRPPGVVKGVWWKRKTCGSYTCISTAYSRAARRLKKMQKGG